MPRKKATDQDRLLTHPVRTRLTVKAFKRLEKIQQESDCQSVEMFIVQPGLSSTAPSTEQLTLLGVVSSYLKSKGLISLTIIGSQN
jgi:ethanolamine ammonia-lyase small subunit